MSKFDNTKMTSDSQVCFFHLENDLISALTSSVSFGRYVVSKESLEWNKCSSSLSGNKYLEEAKKISKPGSVKELKAYFESYYNKIELKKIDVVVDAPLPVQPSETVQTDNNNNDDDDDDNDSPVCINQDLAFEGIRREVTHDFDNNNNNGEGSKELVKIEVIVDQACSIPIKKSKDVTLAIPQQNTSAIKDDVVEQKSSSSREKKKETISSSKLNSSIHGRSFNPKPRQPTINSKPIATKQDNLPPPSRQVKKDKSISTTNFIKSIKNVSKFLMRSKKPTSSFPIEEVVGSCNKPRSSQQGCKQKPSSSVNAARQRPPWR